MNYPQLFFYPLTIQEEFPYQVGSLCKVHLHNFENMEDKYMKIYSKLEAKWSISRSSSSTLSDSEEEEEEQEQEEEEDPITILFENSVSEKYLSSKIERLRKLFDWLNKQWIFSMKKMNSMTITYGRFPLIKIIFHRAAAAEQDETEEITNAFIDLFDFEKHLNTVINGTINHETQQKKYNKTSLEKDRYDSDEYVYNFMSKEKIDAFLDEQRRKKYSIVNLWNRFWYAFDRCSLFTKKTLLLENGSSENMTTEKKLWKVGGPLIAIGLATGGILHLFHRNAICKWGKFF